MALSGVSLASVATPPNNQQDNSVLQQFAQLAKSISSGDLTGAQQAYAQLSQTLGNSSTGSSNSNDPFAQALSAIGQALQSGDIGGAQQALSNLQQQAQAGRGHHHGHRGGHHGGGGGTDAASSSTTNALTNGTSGNTVDVTA